MSTIEALRPESAQRPIQDFGGRPETESVGLAATRRESLSTMLGPLRLAGLGVALVAAVLLAGWALYGPEADEQTARAAQRLAETSSSSPRSILIVAIMMLVLSLLAGWAALRRHRPKRGGRLLRRES